MSSLGFNYFENTPLNNITEFSNKNQDRIKFRLPAVSNQLIIPSDLSLVFTLQVNESDTAPYDGTTLNSNVAVGFDNVAGCTSLFERLEVNNATMNMLLEQNQDIDLYTKMGRCSRVSKNDLKFGYYSCNDLVGINTQHIRQHLTRVNLADDGVPVSINLETPMFSSSYEAGLRTDALGGLIITISLNAVKQALFNIYGANANKLTDDFNFTLKNVKLVGKSYTIKGGNTETYTYRSYNNVLQTLQTNNESISFEPLAQQTHSIISIYQPNNSTRNNFDANALNTNELVGLKSYKAGLSGVNLPYDFTVENTTDLEGLELPSGDNIVDEVGSAENIMHLIGALRTRYKPVHTLITSESEIQSYKDAYADNIYDCSNFRAIGINYSYNFSGYTTNMQQEQFQLTAESLINTNTNKLLPNQWRNTSWVGNFMVNHNKTINLKTLQVAS